MTWNSIGPLSYQGTGRAGRTSDIHPTLRLRVLALSDDDNLTTSGSAAQMHPEDFVTFAEILDGSPAFLQLAGGSDCLTAVEASSSTPRGVVRMDAVSRYNMRVVTNERYDLSVWEGPESMDELDLKEIALEVRSLSRSELSPKESTAGDADESDASDPGGVALNLHRDSLELVCPRSTRVLSCCSTVSGEAKKWQRKQSRHAEDVQATVDARELVKLLIQSHTGRMLTVNQAVTVAIARAGYVLRVSSADHLDRSAREDAVGYHSYRGRLVPDTEVYLTPSDNAASLKRAAESSVYGDVTDEVQSAGSLVLEHARPMPEGSSLAANVVDVYTSDGEHFPVKKRLLRPCIALTALVRAPERAHCNVDADTLTFDRVLIFLESVALSRPAPNFAVHFLEDLHAAGQKLQCQSLASFCEGMLGRLEARIMVHRWQDVKEANSKGRSWLVLDGMVLDVTDWLSVHPGGSEIISAQALNMDCSRFFEVYHASRESFLYLKEFYIGEVSALDLDQIDVAEAPSPDFLSRLRGFTGWRISNHDELPFKSF